MAFSDELTDEALATPLHDRNTKGLELVRVLGGFARAIFNPWIPTKSAQEPDFLTA